MPSDVSSKPRFTWTRNNEMQCEGVRLLVSLYHIKSHPDRLTLLKTPQFVEKYISRLSGFDAKNVMELGIYNGGSTVFFHHLFELDKLVAVELADSAPDLEAYIERMALGDEIRCYFQTSQDNRDALRNIVSDEFRGVPIDLINDDASHFYPETKASFEILFPHLRAGGLYFIEDWRACGLLMKDGAVTPEKAIVHKLILELVMISLLHPDVIKRIEIEEEFVIVERGPATLDPETFAVADYAQNDALPPLGLL